MGSKKHGRRSSRQPMIFDAWNYKALAVGLLMVIVGFVAMYLENEVKGFISLYISPIVIMSGYATVIVAILKHERDSSTTS